MPTSLRFDCFEVDLAGGQLFKRGARIHLREQSFQVLAMLLERPGQVVTREELRRRLWPDEVFVDFDNNLNTAIARLREVLNDSPEHPRYIETLPKRGYRFMASLSGPGPAPERARAQRVRVVVLPFVNLSGDPGQEHVSDAVTDDIITELASAAPEHLAVIARTTAMYYKSRSKDVTRIGRELSVDYVVEGGVRRVDDRIGINVQVISLGKPRSWTPAVTSSPVCATKMVRGLLWQNSRLDEFLPPIPSQKDSGYRICLSSSACRGPSRTSMGAGTTGEGSG